MAVLSEIQNQINRYTYAVNKRDWKELATVFAEQAMWECKGPPDLKFEGRRAIVSGLTESITRAKMLVQMNTPAFIKVDGATASAHSAMREVAEFPSEGVRCEIFGMYEDKLVDANGGWVFQSRRFTVVELRTIKIESGS